MSKREHNNVWCDPAFPGLGDDFERFENSFHLKFSVLR